MAQALDRLLGYVEFRRELLSGDIWEWSCYAGTTLQEVHETYPAIRDACAASIEHHLLFLRAMIDDVLREHPVAGLDSGSLATHFQAVIQGAFVMAKARQDRQAAVDSLDPLKFAGGVSVTLRVAVLVGAEDRITPVELSRAYVEALTLRGIGTDYRIVPGKGHDLLGDPETLSALTRLAASLPEKP